LLRRSRPNVLSDAIKVSWSPPGKSVRWSSSAGRVWRGRWG